ncbi:MAG: hydrogenase expression protein HypE [Candidatus Eremiobacteraeota bacterium]|nr:hydrogenase expression protein HypE [Candidatus Eremiobacteraeota bacterium]
MAIVDNTDITPALTGLKKPLEKIYAFWFAGMSCDGCSIAVTGATNPPLEKLLLGQIPGLPTLVLHHPVLSVDVGSDFTKHYRDAAEGKLDAPYVIILEGSVPDETKSGDGYWSAMGAGGMEEEDAGSAESDSTGVVDGTKQPIRTMDWLAKLAPGAAASIAIGTCATWGGIPAAVGNVTGAMSLMDFLGKDYRSALGLSIINIPGCSPVGDNFMETVAAILLFIQGIGPLPDFDDLGRPAWLFKETVHRNCVRAGYYEEGVFAKKYGDKECLVEIGCWGPVVQCNITSRGAINHMGGCMNTGGVCIGCTMPGFPDKFSPFYQAPPGGEVSSTVSRITGTGIRFLRAFSQRDRNRETRWDETGVIPSGWMDDAPKVSPADKFVHYFYEKLQFHKAVKPGSRKEPD